MSANVPELMRAGQADQTGRHVVPPHVYGDPAAVRTLGGGYD